MNSYRVNGAIYRIVRTSSHSTRTDVHLNVDTIVQARNEIDAVKLVAGPYQGPEFKHSLSARKSS